MESTSECPIALNASGGRSQGADLLLSGSTFATQVSTRESRHQIIIARGCVEIPLIHAETPARWQAYAES